MERLVSSLIYLLSFLLLLTFSVVFVTENTNVISKLYKNNIIDIIQKKSSLEYNFEKLSVKWNGLNPSLIFKNISLHKKGINQHYLDSEKLILQINFLNSISRLKIVPEEINLVRSNIDILYNNNGIYIKDYNFLEKNKNNKQSDINNIKFRITDSNISLNDQVNSNRHDLLNVNMVILKKKNDIELFTTFNHHSASEIVHLASKFSIIDNNINGKIYSQGINLNFEKPIDLYNKLRMSSEKLDYIFWAEISNNKLVNVEGNFKISESRLTNRLTRDRIILNNISSNVFYNKIAKNDNIAFSNLSFKTKSNKYLNNNLKLSRNENSLSDISINKLYIDDFKKILKLLTISSHKIIKNSIGLTNNGALNDIVLLNLDNKKDLKYKLSFDHTSFQNKGFEISNISGHIKGNNQIGFLELDSKDVSLSNQNKKYSVSRVDGNIYLKYLDDKILISSKNIRLDDRHTAKISGSFSSQKINYKIDLKGKVDANVSDLPSAFGLNATMQETKINSSYNVDYRVYQANNKTYAYGAMSLSNLVLKNSPENISLNTKKIRINFFDQYYQSYPSNIFINNNKFLLSIDTDISNGVPKYIANSKGVITDTFIKSFINHKLINSFQGKSLADIQMIYEAKNKKTYVKLKSNLQGMSFDIVSPFKKSSEESTDFTLSYSFQENHRNNLNIKYDIYNIQFSKPKESLYAVVESPYLSGTLVLPETITIDNRLTARLKYFDLNKFQGIADPAGYPYLDMDIKRVKINKYYFEEFKIKTSPLNNGMLIDQLDFSNNYLSMIGNGKWLNSDDGQITLFDANFTSSNFGKALDILGYKNLIKKGLLSSQLIGQWQGSPDYFSLNDFDGKINIDLRNGEFLQVSKQSRAIGQLLGLFSISSLQKRLSLDFSDFFSSGLSFDNMNGEFIFLNSEASAEDLILKGSFGEMRVNGVSHLKNKTHDQKLIYIPDLSSMSLISGTLLGGPVGALASIFYDKVLQKIGIDTNQLAAVEYSIQGSWENPEIKVIESFKPITN